MLNDMHIRRQQIVLSVSKDGTVKTTLAIETNLDSTSPEIGALVDQVVDYMKQNPSIDDADISCPATLS